MTKQAMKRRSFIKKAGVGTAAVAATATLGAPYVKAQKQIKWRLQTYAGVALAEHVIKPAIDDFNKVANGEMVIELFTADQLVPTGELFRAVQKGTLDAAHPQTGARQVPRRARPGRPRTNNRNVTIEVHAWFDLPSYSISGTPTRD